MSILKVNDIQTTAGLPNRGKILQVVQIVKTNVTSGISGKWTDTGLFINITPSTTDYDK